VLGLFERLPEVRIAALCDPDQKRLSQAAENHADAITFADLRQLLDDRDI
jgi:predicted dehydrogenase